MVKRKSFARIPHVFDFPNMVEIQTAAYADFLQLDKPKTKRDRQGLQEVFLDIFPIESYDGKYRLEFSSYQIGRPKYDITECHRRGMSFAGSLKVKVRLVGKNQTKEQEIYLGDLPLMTPTGTFIINGDERVIVSQLHRSPGISFEEEMHASGKRLYSARVIPYRGAWLEFEFDANDILFAYLDRRRKILATTMMRAIGFPTDDDIIKNICGIEKVAIGDKHTLNKLIGRYLASDVINPDLDQTIFNRGEKISKEVVDIVAKFPIKELKIVKEYIPSLFNTLDRDHTTDTEEALLDIYKRLRPSDPPTKEAADSMIKRLFFDSRRYDLGQVGRFMLNRKLSMKVSVSQRILDKDTILNAIKYLINLKSGEGLVDDIDHLGNRRVRTVDELLQNQFRIGLTRLERSVKERMSLYDIENIMPHHLINSKLVSSVVRDFFGRSQLSQFMDQTNPLAELTHKRRLSALGQGGLSRERAGFEVRDVHHSHYGRICPIETPEGPNIGLIASLSTYARVNEFGFMESPYRKVTGKIATRKIEYLSADKEDQYVIAQANAPVDNKGKFLEKKINCRYKGDFPQLPPDKIDYMDVSPRQLVSIAASLIPFLEHDDANRALMGSNMQRQAVPLLHTEAPLVGTGMEYRAAKDSGAVVVAETSGVIRGVQADEIMVGSRAYPLRKFDRSNANTAINQRPLVKIGDKVQAGDIIADGAAIKNGELALGRNVLVAFLPWRGYNFEDAILVSEKMVKEDMFTSVHIEEFEIDARETRLGNEEITRDIPNVGDEALSDLDERGIIRTGAEVEPGDILVGKVAPKSETELSPEEKLLRAIFGEKAGDVRDASLTVPPGVYGVIVDVKEFSRKEIKPKTKEEARRLNKEINEIKEFYSKQIIEIKKEKQERLHKLLSGIELAGSLHDVQTHGVIIARKKLTKADIKKFDRVDIEELKLKEDKLELEEEVKKFVRISDDQVTDLAFEEERQIERLKKGDELPPGVLKKVVVHVASKKKLSVGDKIAGRHGNKGVIAKILPEEDMPYLEDGTPVEIVLNPLGVPSRMNVGQILETHLGWAAKILGISIETPVFDGIREKEIKELMKKANLPENGKVVLYDGLTGDKFDQAVTVGYIYMMKLAHLVDDKIHARSIGPYSLVTQQPLGGKAQFGGQRFGEMEVWALEAYGAAYTLQELLTVKSDDVMGRTRIYEAIVKGENALHAGTPESFNVLVKELQSLGLDVKAEKKKGAASA